MTGTVRRIWLRQGKGRPALPLCLPLQGRRGLRLPGRYPMRPMTIAGRLRRMFLMCWGLLIPRRRRSRSMRRAGSPFGNPLMGGTSQNILRVRWNIGRIPAAGRRRNIYVRNVGRGIFGESMGGMGRFGGAPIIRDVRLLLMMGRMGRCCNKGVFKGDRGRGGFGAFTDDLSWEDVRI